MMGLLEQFLVGAAASSCACVFTNPMEVAKTRLQLQGELGASGKPLGGNPVSALVQIFKNEGIKGFQRGLVPALAYQVTMNGIRLGSYSSFQFQADSQNHLLFFLGNVFAGASAGALGGFCGSPFFLAKVRLQSQANVSIAVGHQHVQKNMMEIIRDVVKKDGLLGLWRGGSTQILRVGVGSAVQLSFYDSAKIFAQGLFDIPSTSTWLHLTASSLTGAFVAIAMNPFDVVATRLYNQPVENGRGLYYQGFTDCFVKIFRTEGVAGFYKGVFAHYLRIAPHTVLTLTFWEQFKQLAENLKS